MSDDDEIFATLRARCERSTAERDAALDALAQLTAHVCRVGGYMEHDDQLALRNARALLAEFGR